MSSCALLLCHTGLYGHPNERKARGNNVKEWYNPHDTKPENRMYHMHTARACSSFLGRKNGGGREGFIYPGPPSPPSTKCDRWGGRRGRKRDESQRTKEIHKSQETTTVDPRYPQNTHCIAQKRGGGKRALFEKSFSLKIKEPF